MRDAYFAGVGRPVQIRTLSQAEWFVCLEGDVPLAALSYTDSPTGERWGNDLYRAPGRGGVRALYRLANWFLAEGDRAAREVFFYVDPSNERHLAALERFGRFQEIGRLFYRGAMHRRP